MEGVDKNSLWESVLAELQLTLSGANFQTWFKGKTNILSLQKGTVEIGCSSEYNKIWIEERYLGKIKEILDRLTGTSNNLVCKVAPGLELPKRKSKKINSQTVPLFENEPSEALQRSALSANLSQKYSFSNFIVGASNQLAYAVAKAIVDEPFDRYNPVLFHGGVGVGKTHLLQAVARAVLLRRSNTKVLYCTSESFTNDMVEAIKNRQTFSFRSRYRGVDFLLVDDIQFIAGRESTQDQFFHTFNELYTKGKQIVLSCDRRPEELAGLETRLKNRFIGGLVAKIDPPDLELREAILLDKSRSLGLRLDFEVIRLLATNLGPSIRELEGALLRVSALARLTGKSLDIDSVKSIINLERGDRGGAENVIATVADFFSVSVGEIKSGERTRRLSLPRQITAYILRKRLGLSFKAIANGLGAGDHTSAIYSVKKVENLVKESGEIQELVAELKTKLETVK